MALDAATKADVVFFLGWPGTSIVPGNVNYNKTIVDRLAIENEEIELQVMDLVAQIKEVRAKLTGSTGRALVKRVGDIELNTGESVLLKSDHRRLLRELSALLDIRLIYHASTMIGLCI